MKTVLCAIAALVSIATPAIAKEEPAGPGIRPEVMAACGKLYGSEMMDCLHKHADVIYSDFQDARARGWKPKDNRSVEEKVEARLDQAETDYNINVDTARNDRSLYRAGLLPY